MPTCNFCKIIGNAAPADIVYRDEQITAFRDRNPQAPTHILIVPNKHIQSINELLPEDQKLIGDLFSVAVKLAAQEKVDQSGYRVVVNTGLNSGQTIFHLHLHLIGGRRMHWPPG
jgi:histidine triad (HIT) family protein